ncbi:hypothetical protein T484DRAFT_1818063 [Baffinella frigidus]|nr:hypothetical protein T484DRAFT_1818063 [Cryptophyta sp. CCMP2293]
MALYKLNETTGGELRLVQTRTTLPGVSAVAHVGLVDRSGHQRHYLVVGASYTSADPSPQDGALHVSDIEAFSIGGVPFLAVAFHSSGATEDVPSYIYRWNSSEVRQADGYTRVVGFVPFEVLPTSGATSATFLLCGPERTPILAISSSLGRAISGATHKGSVSVYRFSPSSGTPSGTSGTFTLAQSIPAIGASGLDLFTILGKGGGDFLVIANRQDQVPVSLGDYSAYDQVPEIHKWDTGAGLFTLHQRLSGPGFESVPDSAAGLDASQAFCSPNCIPGDDGVTMSVPFLRGATGVTAFQSGGETYLAVAQSVCEPGAPPDACPAQPKSAMLQWNRASSRFGPLLSLEDGESVKDSGRELPTGELTTHQYNLRIDGGRAVKFAYLEVGAMRLLILCSLTRGALVLEWDFDKVVGLRGAISASVSARAVLTLDPTP